MLTRLRARNFKRFDSLDIELGQSVVLIGPNNSGKTSALQALALWEIGLRRWNELRKGKSVREKRPGVTVNRRDLVSVPVPDANLLWHDLHVRNMRRSVPARSFGRILVPRRFQTSGGTAPTTRSVRVVTSGAASRPGAGIGSGALLGSGPSCEP